MDVICKIGDEHTFIVENLYPAVTVVSNVYRTRRVINCDSTWVVEFSTFATFTAGGHTMVLVEFQSMECKLWKIYYHMVC